MGNGNLLKVCYGNGAYIRYEYDKQNRIRFMVYFKDAADSKEQNLYRYAYDKQGNIYAVKSYKAGKTYYLFYDFLDRLVRVRDELGSTYEYAYDANNCMESMVHTCGTHTMKTSIIPMTRTAEKQRPDVQRPLKELQSMTSSAECPGVPGIQHLLIYQHILTLTRERIVTVFLKQLRMVLKP